MHTVTSTDGTRIAFWRSGAGPPLLLIHGATADHTTTWRFVLDELGRHFTVHVMDRRGRGYSGDTLPYDLQREAEDVATVVDSIAATLGGPVSVLGHSYGALCAIEASLLTPNLSHIGLYEGVPLRGADYYEPGILDRLDALLDAGDAEEALVTILRDVVLMPLKEIEMLRSHEGAWATRLRNAPSVPRELRTEQRYVFEPDRFRGVTVPVTLLVGGESPPREMANARAVAAALPDSRVVILPGQEHLAMYTAPDEFANQVVASCRRE